MGQCICARFKFLCCIVSLQPAKLLVQGLFLDTTGDQLVGRAENGFLWLWDLTSTLGWERSFRGTSVSGSWLRAEHTRCFTGSSLEVAPSPISDRVALDRKFPA